MILAIFVHEKFQFVHFRAVSREIPTGNSREFPEKSCSRKFPGIISGSREFSGIFYVLRRGNVLNFTIFQMFFFWFRSSFTVEKNTIHAENHWNSSMNCIFLRIGVFLSFYKVSFKVPGNSREFPDWFREIPVPGNENLSGNRPPYYCLCWSDDWGQFLKFFTSTHVSKRNSSTERGLKRIVKKRSQSLWKIC